MFSKLVSYINESRMELKHVNWPDRNETIRLTLVVIGVSVAVGFFLGALDLFFGYLLRAFII
ncbi:MAG: preprotein translocase subunit SecE [Patescibacteria group bacterium]